jgi:CRISPR-associated protein Csx14
MASRLWPEAEVLGWFKGSEFFVAVPGIKDPLGGLADRLVRTRPLVRPCPDAPRFEASIAPVWFEPIELRLDWWLAASGAAMSEPTLKLWSGNQGVAKNIFPGLEEALPRVVGPAAPPGRDLFQRRTPMSGRLGIDPGPAWDPVDVGFSPNEQGLAVDTAPITEVLGAVGLQRFRPARTGRRDLAFSVWSEPLPLIAAGAAAGGALPGCRYSFTVSNRGKYRAFGYATEIEESE